MQLYFRKDIILTFLVRRRYYFHFHGISMLKVQSLAQQPTWILTKFGLPFSALSKLSKWWKQSKTVKNILYFHHEYRICTAGAPENFLTSQAQFSNLITSEILCHFRNYKLKVCRSNGSKLTADCHLSTFCMHVDTILTVICANFQSF